MIIESNKKIFSNLSKFLALALITSTVIFIIFYIPFKNPDYNIYGILYETDQTDKSLRTYFYYLITNFLNNFIGYKDFRFILAILQTFLYLNVFRKLDFKLKNITLFISLPIISFLLLKVHVQIRESIALLIWFITLLEFEKYNLLSFKKTPFAISSFLIHPSTVVVWIPSLIFFTKTKLRKYKRELIAFFYFILAFYIFSSNIKNLIFQKLFSVDFVDLSLPYYQNIDINLFKVLYWLSYFLLFIIVYIDERKKNSSIIKGNDKYAIPYLFGSISIYGLLTFIPTVWILGILKGITGPEYNLIFRVTYILFFLLCFYRSLIYPKSFLTSILNFTIFGETCRLLFF